jgi:hypothetical protein
MKILNLCNLLQSCSDISISCEGESEIVIDGGRINMSCFLKDYSSDEEESLKELIYNLLEIMYDNNQRRLSNC